MLTDNAPDGWVPLGYATQALGVSRQTVLQKVKRGELNAVLTRTGRRKGLRIEMPSPQQACSSRHNQQRSSMTMDPELLDVEVDHPVPLPAPPAALSTASSAHLPGRYP